jgi:hypothetical protein
MVLEFPGIFLSGPAIKVTGTRRGGIITSTFEDDLRLMRNTLAWAVPGNPLNDQDEAYDVRSGPAETVLKAFVTANMITRLGRPVVCAPDLGRGATITVSMRFHRMTDRLLPAVEAAGLGVTFRQIGGVIVCDVFEPPTDVRTLTAESGVITDWTYTETRPTATRGVNGAQGEATARDFTGFADTTLETQTGDIVEVFKDSRNTADPDEVTAANAEVLADGATRYGLGVTLSPTAAWAYGSSPARSLGGMVTLKLGGFPVRTDLMRTVTMTVDEKGVRVAPAIGDLVTSPGRAIARVLAGLGRSVRDMQAGD